MSVAIFLVIAIWMIVAMILLSGFSTVRMTSMRVLVIAAISVVIAMMVTVVIMVTVMRLVCWSFWNAHAVRRGVTSCLREIPTVWKFRIIDKDRRTLVHNPRYVCMLVAVELEDVSVKVLLTLLSADTILDISNIKLELFNIPLVIQSPISIANVNTSICFLICIIDV